ncbi:MAG: zinc-dependent alcohol dehydrogenase [Candidatus Thorarchaeota archaeon]|nr:MAG: hypothetical protein DRP09_04820 [Candidatus Thorarchaeota archaeon]
MRSGDLRGLMKTARGPGNLELRELDDPTPSRDQVLVEVAASGICGTDVHIKHDQTFYTPPVVLGHEYSGVVVDVGPDVTGVNVGDRVVSPATAYCGKCYQCKTGHMNRCTSPTKRILGTSLANGAFAKYLLVPEYIVHQVPKGVTMEEAALAEPTACVVHSVIDKSPIQPGDVVVVQGAGSMGLLSAQIAKTMGAGKVIMTGVTADEWRFEIARKTGTDLTIDVMREKDAVGIVMGETDGVGADVVIEASGAGPATKQAFEFVKVAGHVTLLGIRGRPLEIDLDPVVTKELTMSGTWGTLPATWVTTLRLMASKKIDVAPLITHRMSLSQWAKGFELMESQQALKVLFTDFE